jgi:RNA polymerase sigma-70 factor (ECF subfamily)
VVVSDAVLVKEVLDGAKDAYAQLVRRYERPAKAAAIHTLGNYHSAEDAAQEAFVKAYQQLPGLKNPEMFGSWLMIIVHRCALDIAAKKRPTIPLDNIADMPVHRRNGRLDDEKQHLLREVMRLADSEKQVVFLRYFGGHTVSQIADITGRSVGTVTKQLSRAYQSLRNQIKESL